MTVRDSDGLTPITRAAKSGRILCVCVMIRAGFNVLEARDPRGRSFLHYLRLRTADVNAREKDSVVWICKLILYLNEVAGLRCSQDHDGNTPLHLAVMEGDFVIPQLFLKWYIQGDQSSARKELSIRNNEGKSVIDLIKLGSHIPAMLKKQLEQAIKGRIMDEDLYQASMNGDVSVLQRSLVAEIPDHKDAEQGDDDHNDDTGPVDKDDTNDHKDYTKHDGKGDTHVDNYNDDYFLRQAHDGSNVIHIAIRHGHTIFIETALKRFPCLIYQKDSNGDTPLHIAARLQTDEAFRFLELSCNDWIIKIEENLSCVQLPPWLVKNSRGNGMLHELARTNNHYQLISSVIERPDNYKGTFLVQQSSSIYGANDNGETLLHLFARYGTYADEFLLPLLNWSSVYLLLQHLQRCF